MGWTRVMETLVAIIMIPILLMIFIGIWEWWVNGISKSITGIAVSVSRAIEEDKRNRGA